MAIKLDCPRCKHPLSVPQKKIDSYVKCPRCGGRFWVSEDLIAGCAPAGRCDSEPDAAASQGAEPSDTPSGTVSVGSAATVSPGELVPETREDKGNRATQRPETSAGKDSSGASWHVVASASSPASGASPSAGAGGDAGPGRKTARLILADAAQSPLRVAEDGQLPELQLQEGRRKEDGKEEKTTAGNPLVLFGVLSISVVLSIALALFNPGSAERPRKERARGEIEARYFPREGEKTVEYQEYLMKAQRAATRGDDQTERKMYEAVLILLRQERPAYAENGGKEWSVTGSAERDETLKGLLSDLLSDE